MDTGNFVKSMEVENKNKEICLEVALILNKELFDDNKISYKMFKYAEENILNELNNYNWILVIKYM